MELQITGVSESSICPQTLLTKSQLSKVATSDLLSDSEVRTNHCDCLAGNAGSLAGTVARPFADTGDGRDLPNRFGTQLRLRPNIFGTLSSLRSHCPDQPELHVAIPDLPRFPYLTPTQQSLVRLSIRYPSMAQADFLNIQM